MDEREIALIALLAAGARLGRRSDMVRLIEAVQPRLFRHALRLTGQRADAEDLTQEAWVSIARGLHGLMDDRAFVGWALRIVTRAAGRQSGRRWRRAQAEDGFASQQVQETAPGHDLAEAIRALPRDQALVMGLFYTEGLGISEIALALEIAPGTVKSRLFHGRAAVRRQIEGEKDGQS